LRAYAALASELEAAGYTAADVQTIKTEVDHFTKVRDEVRLASGDYIDLKAFEPAMRHLIDTYIRAEESEKISAFDDLSLIQLIVDRGAAAVDALPASIRKNQTAVAETIENNVRRLIVKESPVDPAYYEKMSKLLDALIAQRRQGVIDYKKYLDEIAALTKAATTPGGAPATYPPALDTPAKRALYNNLGKYGTLAVAVDEGIRKSVQDGWRSNPMKLKRVRRAIHSVLTTHASRLAEPDDGTLHSVPRGSLGASEGLIDETTDKVLELAKNQHEY
jgi:type I restriction enzyme R subunit